MMPPAETQNLRSRTRPFNVTPGVTLVLLAFAGAAPAQLTPEFLFETASLNRTNTTPREGIGYAVGISGDWIVSGAPDESSVASSAGAAFFYQRSGGTWAEQVMVTGDDTIEGDLFGNCAALDGQTALIGAWARDSYRGAAYVFTRNGDWSQQQKLEAPDGVAFDQFGATLDLDGDLAVVGAPAALAGAGAAYIFRRDVDAARNAWNIIDVSGAGATLHYARALTAGDVAAAANGWSLEADIRLLDDLAAGPSLNVLLDDGTSRFELLLDFDAQGALVAHLIGATPGSFLLTTNRVEATLYHTHEIVFDPVSETAAYRYDGVQIHAWTGTASVTPEVRWGVGSAPGRGNMNYHLVQARIDDATVALYDAGTHGTAPAAITPASQGWTLVGGPSPNAFEFPVSPDPTTYWTMVQKLTSSIPYTPNRGDFGSAVAIQGETIVVGGQYIIHPDAATGGGAVFVYERSGELWTEIDSFASADNQNLDRFGVSVDIDAGYIAVGATGEDGPDAGGDEGAAYVFARAGNTWVQQEKLVPANHTGRDSFGNAIRITAQGSLIAVGSRSDDPGDPFVLNSGSVFFFSRVGTDWIERFHLTPASRGYQEMFGSSLDIDHATLVVGAPGFFSPGTQENYGDRVLVFETDYTDTTAVIDQANALLYPPNGSAGGYFDQDLAAFRYKQFLYGVENGEFRAQFETFDSLYGDTERDRSREAEDLVRAALQANPNVPFARDLLLDIHYDRLVAETVVAKNVRSQADRDRLNIPAGTGYVIDSEIPLYEQAVQDGRDALTDYFSLLDDDLGAGADPPLGYQIFQQQVPGRGLAPAQGTNAAGTVVSVLPVSMLYNGYKDLVLLFDLLREYGRNVVTLCQLKAGRGGPGDLMDASALSEEAQRYLFLQGSLLLDLFPGLDPQPGDDSGLAEAMDGWRGVIDELNQLQPLLSGRVNPFGFEDNFLMLVEPSINNPALPFDSFNALADELDPVMNANSPLGVALDRLTQAREDYDLYRGYQSQLQQQFEDATSDAEDRLFAIVGARPGQPGYDTPGSIIGSEIWQQTNSIEVARIRILRNRAEITILNEEVEIELQKATSISNTLIDYGVMQAELTQEIGNINAAQAGAEAFAETFSLEKLNPVSIFANGINGGVQIGGELLKAQAETEKEQTAAMEQAVLAGIESAAAVKTKLLGMKTLALDSQEAAVLMKQEVGRYTGLLREKADLEATIAESKTTLASRYFADPIHRLRAQRNALRANLAFDRARLWIFFMARALDYKWNTPFQLDADDSADGRDWSAQSLFKLRNAEELGDMYQAMLDYDSLFELFGPTRSVFYDWFSVREDFLGYRMEEDGEPERLYPDPDGGPVPVNAITAFQRRLKQIRSNSNLIRLPFSTVRQNPGGTFFRGPKYLEDAEGQFIRDPSGNRTLIDRGLWLDKIDWIKVRLPGDYPAEDIKTARLTYGGTSFIRNERLGMMVDPERPDRIADELTPYTTRYWFYTPSAGTAIQNASSKSVTIQYLKSAASRLEGNPQQVLPELNEVLKINAFRERAVAASQWVLEIQTSDGGVPLLNLDHVHDIEFGFVHTAAERPEF